MKSSDRIFMGFIVMVLFSLSIHQIAADEALSPAVFIAVMVVGVFAMLMIYYRNRR